MRRRRGDGFGDIDWSRVDWREVTGWRGGPRAPRRRTIVLWAVLFVVFVVPIVLAPLVEFWTDLLWFRSLGFDAVYLRRYTAAFAAFAVFFAVFYVFAAANVLAAFRPRVIVPRVVDVGPAPARPFSWRLAAAIVAVPALFFGLAAADRWDDLLRFVNATAFGVADPVFGQDASFYVFTLPVLGFARGWALAATVVTALGILLVYVLRGVADVASAGFEDVRLGARAALALARPVRAHLSILGALFLVLVAVGYQLDRFELLYQPEATFLTGPGYASVNARLPALALLTVIALVAGVLLLLNAWARTLWLLGATLGVWLAAAILVGGIYPAAVERLVVQPAQLDREREYIGRHIAGTRAAFGIDGVRETAFDVKEQPTPDDVRRDITAIENIRLWDWRPLQTTLTQIQAIRNYYEFADVDVTRVAVGGKPLQLMVAARELNVEKVPRSWVNLHLSFTHGYGAVATPVSAVTAEGLPGLTLRDIPPQGEPRVERPQIYFGELTRHYVVVGSTQEEFDYPIEERERTTRFTGDGGIGIGGLWDRLLFSWRFGDLNLLISSQLTGESRLLMHRHIEDRASLIAPFLLYDHDPYLAFDAGRLFWIHDAYTSASRYPYSRHLGTDLGRDAFVGGRTAYEDVNYIRNSVKVITDAYDGTISFYVADPNDPIVRTLEKIYPTLFTPLSAMPAGLRAQLRYPEDLFRVQAAIYGRYHVVDPTTFYNGADWWQVASELFEQGGAAVPVEPYYVITRLPDEQAAEFLLFVPMTPRGRPNMIGWLAGRADEPHYGELRALRFAGDRAIFGPEQVEARINQDPTIQPQLALLSQAGTEIVRGNLLVIPVGQSFLYIEPIFIRAKGGGVPELRRVVLATQTRVVMADTFSQALASLVGAAVETPPVVAPTQPPTATPSEVQSVVRSASEHYDKAQKALRQGDFATFGSELSALEKDLARLRELTGVR